MQRTWSWQSVIAGIGLCALVGCASFGSGGGGSGGGGTGGGGPGPGRPGEPDKPPVTNPLRDAFMAANTGRSDLFDRRRAFEDTEEDDMPGHGQVVYTGFGSVAMETARTSFMAIGDATITADFRTSALEGTIDNFLGRTVSGDEARYAGSLTFSGETGGAAFRDNRFIADVAGTLTGAGRTMQIDSEVSGGFRGDDPDVLFATTDDDNRILLNGVRTDATVQIIADR